MEVPTQKVVAAASAMGMSLLDGPLGIVHDALGMLIEDLPRLGEGDAMVGAKHQLQVQMLFRALICLITAVEERYRASAALLKLPQSATWTKASSCGLYMVCPLVCSNFWL